MAATYDVDEVFSQNLSSSIDDEGIITESINRNFNILLSDGLNDNVYTVRANSLIPRKNDPHPNNFNLRVTNVDVSRVSLLIYECAVTYDSPPRPESSEEETLPFEWAAQVEWRAVSSDEAVDEDISGAAIVTAGTYEPIEGVTMPIADLAVSITKNMPTFNPLLISEYTNAVNSDTFLGFAAGLARVMDISARTAVKEDIPYIEVNAVIQFRKPIRTTAAKAWYVRTLNKGFYEVKGGRIVRARDDENEFVSAPILLDAAGARTTTAHFLEFEVMESKPFSALGLL
jgi:hypothetical protein